MGNLASLDSFLSHQKSFIRTVQSALRGAGRHEQETAVSRPAPDPMGNKAGYKWIKSFLQPEFWKAKGAEEREWRIRQRGEKALRKKQGWSIRESPGFRMLALGAERTSPGWNAILYI